MTRKYKISKEEAEKIKEYRKGVKDKYLDRRLYAVQLIGEGMKTTEIAQKLDADRRQISRWAGKFCTGGGIQALDTKRGGRHCENMSIEEEQKFIEQFKEKAEAGEIVEVSEIKKAYEEKIGRKIKSKGHIYLILKRNGWRKIMPRPKHPKKADDEVIKASKKLNQK